jgi:hypothetical protein
MFDFINLSASVCFRWASVIETVPMSNEEAQQYAHGSGNSKK